MSQYQRLSFYQRVFVLHCLLAVAGIFMADSPAQAGPYLDSAHGSALAGVRRGVMASAGYGQGNCAHCHEMHNSLGGAEPAPVTGAAQPYALFSPAFNPALTSGPYVEADNFCFYCHNGFGSAQVVLNGDYSAVFGGGNVATDSILATFNQLSYHNLGDIRNLAITDFAAWFTAASNPCNACHNPHLAKRNGIASLAGYPLLSALSKPTDHFNLWGETQLMSAYSSYEAPYSNAVTASREPGGVGDINGSKTPDYVSFCVSCHTSTNSTIFSTTIYTASGTGRNLLPIDWSSSGDKHGNQSRGIRLDIREPYLTAGSTKSNFVLSCLDCHDPHGSANVMLLRRRVNGEDLASVISSTATTGEFCRHCHLDDLLAGGGTSEENKWMYSHHSDADAPYKGPISGCSNCHHANGGGGPPIPIPCDNCHFHGGDDSWLATQPLPNRTPTYRKTF